MIIDKPTRSQIPFLRSIWREAFGDTEEFLDVFERTAFSVDRCRCVTVDGEVVAALYWFDCQYMGRRIAYLYAIATAKAYRGQGICHKLMEDTHRHLEGLGYEGAILVPSKRELFEFYKGIGYLTCSHIREFRCDAAESKIEVREITPCEYAQLRRSFLPSGAVVQENENLEFLQTQAAFYTGDGFLLAARGENDTLCGIELLGDESAAPKIVRALGCTEGSFRTVGTDVPFAMYRPVSESKLSPPTYFGLAFDK